MCALAHPARKFVAIRWSVALKKSKRNARILTKQLSIQQNVLIGLQRNEQTKINPRWRIEPMWLTYEVYYIKSCQ